MGSGFSFFSFLFFLFFFFTHVLKNIFFGSQLLHDFLQHFLHFFFFFFEPSREVPLEASFSFFLSLIFFDFFGFFFF